MFRLGTRNGTRSGRGAGLLTLGGLVAAFGVASCCAIPLLLTVLGVSATWLFGIAVVAAPYRASLLVIAALCLLGGAGLLWRQQQAAATCGPEWRTRTPARSYPCGASIRCCLARSGLCLRLIRRLSLESVITCPKCGAQAKEVMPTDACWYFYECRSCGAVLRPKAGDCCVFCSYGTVPCPPIQQRGKPGCCCPSS